MSALNWILTVGAVAAGSAVLAKGKIADVVSNLQKTRADIASQAADEFQGAADTINKGIDGAETVAKALWTPPKSAAQYLPLIDSATNQYNLPPLLLARVLWQESHFRPEIVFGRLKSPRGATGIAQFLPSTADDLSIDPNNPREAIPGAARYLAQLYAKFNDWEKVIAAYDWGQGNVARHWNGVDALPKETQNYVVGVLGDIGLI